METMEARCNRYLKKALDMSRELTILADEGEARCADDGCAVLYGVIRDCAYKIRGTAEREKEIHRRMGIWDGPDKALNA
jgi:hypothetical protein